MRTRRCVAGPRDYFAACRQTKKLQRHEDTCRLGFFANELSPNPLSVTRDQQLLSCAPAPRSCRTRSHSRRSLHSRRCISVRAAEISRSCTLAAYYAAALPAGNLTVACPPAERDRMCSSCRSRHTHECAVVASAGDSELVAAATAFCDVATHVHPAQQPSGQRRKSQTVAVMRRGGVVATWCRRRRGGGAAAAARGLTWLTFPLARRRSGRGRFDDAAIPEQVRYDCYLQAAVGASRQ